MGALEAHHMLDGMPVTYLELCIGLQFDYCILFCSLRVSSKLRSGFAVKCMSCGCFFWNGKAFVYDFFFTKYAAVYYRSGVAICMSVASACLISVIAYLTASHVYKISSRLTILHNT